MSLSGDRNVTRRALAVVPFLLLALIVTPAAQQSPAPASAPQDSSAAPQGSSAAQKNKKHKKDDAADAAVFDERAAAEVLGTIRDGLEGHSQHLLLSAFDGDKMDGFLSFEDQIEAYFTRYESFRVTLRIVQTSEENSRGVILADFQLENEPRGGGRISRRQGQLRFELERGTKGWKIVDFDPRGFFS
jgi:hypothetical protein